MKKALVALMVALFIGGAVGCKKQDTTTPTPPPPDKTAPAPAPDAAPK
jgi:hypothetical protein